MIKVLRDAFWFTTHNLSVRETELTLYFISIISFPAIDRVRLFSCLVWWRMDACTGLYFWWKCMIGRNISLPIILTLQNAGLNVSTHARFLAPNSLSVVIVMHHAAPRSACVSACVFTCTKAWCIFNSGLSELLVKFNAPDRAPSQQERSSLWALRSRVRRRSNPLWKLGRRLLTEL